MSKCQGHDDLKRRFSTIKKKGDFVVGYIDLLWRFVRVVKNVKFQGHYLGQGHQNLIFVIEIFRNVWMIGYRNSNSTVLRLSCSDNLRPIVKA